MSCFFSRLSCWNTSAPFYRDVLAPCGSSCSGHSGVASTEVFVLRGQVGFLFMFTVTFPCCFLLPALDAFLYLGIGIRSVLNFIQIVNNFEFFVVYPMCGVSVNIPQRTDEFFEQNLAAALSRGRRGKWWIFVSLSFVCVGTSNLMASKQVLEKEWGLTHAFQEFAGETSLLFQIFH